jgi:hypothetical protein
MNELDEFDQHESCAQSSAEIQRLMNAKPPYETAGDKIIKALFAQITTQKIVGATWNDYHSDHSDSYSDRG